MSCFSDCFQSLEEGQWENGLFTSYFSNTFNFAMVRNYIRQGYGIDGRIGINDCCCSLLCYPCIVTQLLNEVSARGQRLRTQDVESVWKATNIAADTCSGDPFNFLCTCLTCQFEVAQLYSNFAGVPCWFACCSGGPCINICQIQHLIRKSYGIAGNDFYSDCIQPCICLIVPLVNCTYFFHLMQSLRAEIESRGVANSYHHDRMKFNMYKHHDNKE